MVKLKRMAKRIQTFLIFITDTDIDAYVRPLPSYECKSVRGCQLANAFKELTITVLPMYNMS